MRKTLPYALLATFCAILCAAPLEGGGVMLIAGRNAMLAGGGLSAKDYVQSGLVAMWDGIENAGWGVHDANATTWKDLSGNGWNLIAHEGRSNVLPTFEAQCARLDKNCFYVYDGAIGSGSGSKIPAAKQLEFVVKTISTGDNCVCEFKNSNIAVWGWYGKACPVKPGWGKVILGFNEIAKSVNGYSYDISEINNFKIYLHGLQTLNVQNGQGFGSMNKNGLGFDGWYDTSEHEYIGDIYCVRLYSRALTAAEVAANYAVDKARFNLA